MTTTENQTIETPSLADDPATDPQGAADESQTDGGAPEGGESTDQAPSIPKYAHQFRDEFKRNPAVIEHENINDLVADYVRLKEKIADSVSVPGDDADDQAFEAFIEKVRPESADAYEIGAPEGMKISDDELAAYKKVAHEAGLTKRQAKHLHDWNMGRHIERAKQQQAGIDQLRQEWGDKFETNFEGAKRALNAVADKPTIERLAATGLLNHPDSIRFFHSLSGKISSDSAVPGSTTKQGSIEDAWYDNTNFDA